MPDIQPGDRVTMSFTVDEIISVDRPPDPEPPPDPPAESLTPESVAWSQVYWTNFPKLGPASTALGPEWQLYDSIGNNGFGFRRPEQVEVRQNDTVGAGNGQVLQITAENDGEGRHLHGAARLKVPLTFAQYEFRMRVDKDPRKVTSGVALSWEASAGSPGRGETNWSETFAHRDTRKPTQSFLHTLSPGPAPVAKRVWDDVDQSQWNKIVGTWLPSGIWISWNNGPHELLSDHDIPMWPMELVFQLDAWSDTPPAAPVRQLVDYVIVRKPLLPAAPA